MGQAQQTNTSHQTIIQQFPILNSYHQCSQPFKYKHKEQQEIAIMRTFNVNKNKVVPNCQYYEKRKNMKECEQVIKVLDYQIMSVCSQVSQDRQNSFCSMKSSLSKQESKKLIILSEQIGIKLQQQIQNRKSKQPFEEIQLWSVISSCIMGTFSMLELGLKEPILSPKTISLTKQGIIKIGQWETVCPQLQSYEHYDKNKFNQVLSNYYWPPQGFKALQSAMVIGQVDKKLKIQRIKNQIFSLGMTLVSMCLRELFYQIQTFSQKQLHNLLQRAYKIREEEGKPLSSQLKEIIKNMVRWQNSERISYAQLRDIVINYFQNQETLSNSSIHNMLSQTNTISIDMFNTSNQQQSLSSDNNCRNSGFQSFQGSGMISQGLGDNYEPQQQENVESKKKKGNIIPISYNDTEDVVNNVQYYCYGLQIMNNSEHQNPDLFVEEEEFESRRKQPIKQCRQQETKCNPISQEAIGFVTFNSQNQSFIQQIQPNNQTNENLFTDPKLLQFIKTQKKCQYQDNSFHSVSHTDKENLQLSNNQLQYHLKPVKTQKIYESISDDDDDDEHSFIHRIDNMRSESDEKRLVKQEFAKGYYEGQKKNNMRNGYGVFYYHEGGKYKGNWVNNKMHGKGTLQYADGRIAYQGDWYNDQLDGKGILYNQSPLIVQESLDFKNFNKFDQCWLYYDGQFKNDDKNGNGLLVLSNGQQFYGEFKNDMVDGIGQYTNKQRIGVKGQWRKNKLIHIIS